jgi:hypothetical protein
MVEHIDMQACGEIRHSRPRACSGIPWDSTRRIRSTARADGDVVEFRFQARSGGNAGRCRCRFETTHAKWRFASEDSQCLRVCALRDDWSMHTRRRLCRRRVVVAIVRCGPPLQRVNDQFTGHSCAIRTHNVCTSPGLIEQGDNGCPRTVVRVRPLFHAIPLGWRNERRFAAVGVHMVPFRGRRCAE